MCEPGGGGGGGGGGGVGGGGSVVVVVAAAVWIQKRKKVAVILVRMSFSCSSAIFLRERELGLHAHSLRSDVQWWRKT